MFGVHFSLTGIQRRDNFAGVKMIRKCETLFTYQKAGGQFCLT